MREEKSLKRNILYNFSLNIINILFPLMTSPYVSRILGADNLGKYNFSLSFSSWFLVFATFGTTTYGIREIAKVRDNKKLLDKTFSEIFMLNFIATIITLIIYIITILINSKTNIEITLFLISAISIFMNLFFIDWFYMGIEDFKMTTLRSLFIKLISLVSIFIFVNQREDYQIYALISVMAFGFANLFNFIYSRKFVTLTFLDLNLKKHLGKLSIFFYSTLIVSMYTLFDQVFLGFLATNKDVAFYSRSKQIYSIALSITLSISVVLLPKLTYLYKNDFENYKILLKKSINYIYIFSVPSVLGLMVLSRDIMWIFGGNEFEEAYKSLIILALLVFTVSLGTWQYNQLFLPLGREKVGLKAQMFIAIVSIISNIILIPKLGYMGASLGLVMAEVSGTIYGVYYAKNNIKEIKIKYITKSLVQYLLSGLIMSSIILMIKYLNKGYSFNIIFGIGFGAIVYFGVLYMIKEETCLNLVDYVRNKLSK